jgi:hypothetical protein
MLNWLRNLNYIIFYAIVTIATVAMLPIGFVIGVIIDIILDVGKDGGKDALIALFFAIASSFALCTLLIRKGRFARRLQPSTSDNIETQSRTVLAELPVHDVDAKDRAPQENEKNRTPRVLEADFATQLLRPESVSIKWDPKFEEDNAPQSNTSIYSKQSFSDGNNTNKHRRENDDDQADRYTRFIDWKFLIFVPILNLVFFGFIFSLFTFAIPVASINNIYDIFDISNITKLMLSVRFFEIGQVHFPYNILLLVFALRAFILELQGVAINENIIVYPVRIGVLTIIPFPIFRRSFRLDTAINATADTITTYSGRGRVKTVYGRSRSQTFRQRLMYISGEGGQAKLWFSSKAGRDRLFALIQYYAPHIRKFRGR